MLTLSFDNGFIVTIANDKNKYLAVASWKEKTAEVLSTDSAIKAMIFALEQAEHHTLDNHSTIHDSTETINLRPTQEI